MSDAGCDRGRRHWLSYSASVAALAVPMRSPLSALSALSAAVATSAQLGCARSGGSATPFGRPVEVAAGAYLLRGLPGEPSVANQGRVGNAGFIVGDDAVIGIDSGTSHAHGAALLAAIATVTPKRVTSLVLTQARQEFIFGASAYYERGTRTVMQRRAAQLMALRCDRCLRNLQRLLGEPAMRGTALVVPDELVDAGQTLDVGGRPVQLTDHGHSAGPGDLSVTDVRSGVVFAGGLVDVLRIPDIQDADLAGWHRALDALARQSPRTVVPGHGPAAPAAAAIAASGGYLTALTSRVQALLQEGAALSDVPAAAALPAYAGWDGYPHLHARNAASLYVRLEREQLLG